MNGLYTLMNHGELVAVSDTREGLEAPIADTIASHTFTNRADMVIHYMPAGVHRSWTDQNYWRRMYRRAAEQNASRRSA